MKYCVFITRNRRRLFATLGEAKAFCDLVFKSTNVILTIVEAGQ